MSRFIDIGEAVLNRDHILCLKQRPWPTGGPLACEASMVDGSKVEGSRHYEKVRKELVGRGDSPD